MTLMMRSKKMSLNNSELYSQQKIDQIEYLILVNFEPCIIRYLISF